jgi:UDP-glucuronate 4-epimerase
MTILVTGVAGFIGFHLARVLLERGERVIGIDNLNEYYDLQLKKARLEQVDGHPGFSFHQVDVADQASIEAILATNPEVDRIVHLAAQAGVRYSLTNPEAYVQANLVGKLALLEACRQQGAKLKHLVFASSSSVYGANQKLPFAVGDRIDRPKSLYAATKCAGEAMAAAYSHLFKLPTTGLRFFTVYGPWGRPDMSAYIFTQAILRGAPIRVFNQGQMMRDFTYIDDIVAGIAAVLDRPPAPDSGDYAPLRIYNLGNHRSEPLMRMIGLIEEACGRKAQLELVEMQPGDVLETCAEIDAAQQDFGFYPRTTIDEGIPRFVAWYRQYHGV